MKKLFKWVWVNFAMLFYLYLGGMFLYYSTIDDVSEQIFHGVLLIIMLLSIQENRRDKKDEKI